MPLCWAVTIDSLRCRMGSKQVSSLTGAFELSAVLIGTQETFRHAVAQFGDVVQLQHVSRFVDLAAEITFFDVQEEGFLLQSAGRNGRKRTFGRPRPAHVDRWARAQRRR